MFTTTAPDGTTVRAYDQGSGPPILIVGPGTDDGTRTIKLAGLLEKRFRVLRLHRRQYRLDLKDDPKNGSACSIQAEVEHVLAVTEALDGPVILYGHSSGGVVALEAVLRSPRSFAGAVLYEPPVITPEGDLGGAAVRRARAALVRGRAARAYEIFTREGVGLPPLIARLAGLYASLLPRYRRLIPCQLDDLEALTGLGNRLEAYARIELPIVLLGGDRSPTNLIDRLDRLEDLLRDTERVTMARRDHAADVRAPAEVARVIERLADRVLPTRRR